MENFTIKRLKNYAFFIFALFGFQQTFSQCPTIVWQDEFDGTTLDQTKWSYQIGDGCDQSLCGWGNNELQSYQEGNVVVSNGSLKITAKKERIRGTQYTSGRLTSKGKGDFTYGRFEASIKLPAGDGLWPAFWMLSTDEQYGSWPQSGEIDIMEYVASTPDEILGYIHYGDLYPNNQSQGNSIKLKNDVFYNAFHEFAVEWEPGEIRWFMDGILYSTKTPEDISPANWPFDKDFHFLLNVAVGGNLGGDVVDNMLPATMEVDYVRVYDSFKPYVTGDLTVANQEAGVEFTLKNVASNVNVTWDVPAGASVVSGQGSTSILVDFGTESGLVSASFNDGCTSQSLSIPVEVEPPYIKSFSFENFDEPSTVTFVSSSGTLSEVSNPATNTVNSSAISGKYVRDNQSQYDLIRYSVSDITDASSYVLKDKKFYMDVYSSAPIGTEIILQLETADATASNFPVGRHSRYSTVIKENNSWHRLEFNLLDKPDPAALDTAVETMYLLFNSNTFTSDTYYYDNLDSYNVDNGTVSNQNPSITITNPTQGQSFASGSTISITADATDADGTIDMVEFFVNGSSIGTDASSPYSMDWQVVQGTSEITAVATDNNAASTSSQAISVTGTSTGTPTSLYVSSIITGTADAGKGSKYGNATVTIIDDLGQPVPNVTVTGTFSGSFNDQGTAITNSEGKAIIQTSTSAKGSLIVEFCVNNVVHSTLAYDSSSNLISCTSGAQKTSSQDSLTKNSLSEINEDVSIKFLMSPNPTRNIAQFSTEGMESIKSLKIYDMSGRLMFQKYKLKKTGELDISNFPKGVYLVKIQDALNQTKTIKLIKK